MVCLCPQLELISPLSDPVKFRLISLEAATTILKLSTAIYPPGRWLIEQDQISAKEEAIEQWTLRCSLSNWAWRTISELKDVKDDGQLAHHFTSVHMLIIQQHDKFLDPTFFPSLLFPFLPSSLHIPTPPLVRFSQNTPPCALL
jgi:hypothetical protein